MSSKVRWAILLAVIICVTAVAGISFLNKNDSQHISDVPREGRQQVPGLDPDTLTGDEQPIALPEIPVLYERNMPINPQLSREEELTLSNEEKLTLIRAKYMPVFEILESYYQRDMDNLVELAKNDYRAANGNVSQLAYKYTAAARALEKEADRSFNSVLGQMKAELRAHNLPLELARQVEREYKEQKGQRRQEMFNKVAGRIND